jgi:hypothetical protein
MSNALMGFMTWLALKWGDRPREARSTFLIYLLFYLLALSVGFHLGTILVFSGIFFFVLMTREKGFTDAEFILACIGVAIFVADATLYRNSSLTLFFLVLYAVALVWMWAKRKQFPVVSTALFVLGLSVHLYLYIRSGHNPSIDEGNPETWRNLYWVLRREQYPPMNVCYFMSQFQLVSAWVLKLNVGAFIPIALGIWGMVDQYTKNRKTFVMLFVTTMVVSFGLISFLNFSDTEVRERDYFYSPAFYYFAIYIGIGAASLLNEFRNLFERRKANPAPALYGFAVVLLILPFFTLKNHYHTHDRSQNYTCAEYARNALVGLEKDAIIFTNGDNDTFPLWYIQEVEKFRTDVKVVNMSLLQTPWYIIQCRDNEPKAPISWTDEQIYRLTPVPTKDGWLRVSDVAMQHILRTNNWERPIYVSTTVPRTTYAPYLDILELEGLVFRFVPRKGENMVNEELLKKNVTERYDFSSILDEHGKRRYEVYLPAHTQNLITHYSYSYMRLAVIQHRDSLFDDAVTSLERAREISPILPEPAQLLGWYYLDAGDTLKAVGFYNDELRQQPGNVDLRFRLAGVYERIGDDPNALEQLEMIIQIEPNNRDAVMAATGIAFRNGQTAKARGIVTSWLRIRPDDAGARSVLQEIDGKLQEGASPQ